MSSLSNDDVFDKTSQSWKEAYVELQHLWQKGVRFLGTKYSILGGAMSWLSERHLVAAISNAGGFGVIACGAMSAEQLDIEITETKALTNKNFGVNLIVMHQDLNDLVDVCIAHKVGHIVLAGGIPSISIIKRIKQHGISVIAFAPALSLGKRLIKNGVDALIIEGSEAGGHVGPVSLNVLAQEILPYIKSVPIFVAGGLYRGEAIVSYLERGACGAQLGTVFAASTESIAHDNFKKAFLRANARDAVVSVQIDETFPVVPVRSLENAAGKRFIAYQIDIINKVNKGELLRKDAQMAIEHFWAGALRRAAIDGDIENGSLMAGQSVGMVKTISPVKEIMERIVDEAVIALIKKKDLHHSH